MVNLMVSIIAIALIAAVALAAVFYGSTSWDDGTTQAEATTLINQQEQIKQAASIFRSTGAPDATPDPLPAGLATDVSQLVDANLLTLPAFAEQEWKSSEDKIFVVIDADATAVTNNDLVDAVVNSEYVSICQKAWAEITGEAPTNMPNIGSCEDIGTSNTDICCYTTP
jgi:hypothetical protein